MSSKADKTKDLTSYFYTPSPLGKSTFLYPLCVGHFFCDDEYCIARNSYNSFLIMLIIKGRGYAENLGEHPFRCTFKENDIVLLDCYAPCMYGADSDLEFYWLHFDGINARAYFDYLVSTCGHITSVTGSQMQFILQPYYLIWNALTTKNCCTEMQLAQYITELLSFPDFILSHTDLQHDTEASLRPNLNRAISHMRQHFSESITICELAKTVSVSTYHFIRIFKQKYGITPHKYLQNIRLDAACYYLSSTDKSIKDIAFSCGFQSENNFCIAFKKQLGLTPGCFRKTPIFNL